MEIIMPETKIVCEEIPTPPIKLFSRPAYHFILTGDINKDQQLLDSITFILTQKRNLDSNAFILQVTLGDYSKYWEMIKLFDVCYALGFNRFALFDNEFRVYASRGGQEINIDYKFIAPILLESKPKNRFSIFLQAERRELNYIHHNLKLIWPSPILYLLMLILTIWRFIRS